MNPRNKVKKHFSNLDIVGLILHHNNLIKRYMAQKVIPFPKQQHPVTPVTDRITVYFLPPYHNFSETAALKFQMEMIQAMNIDTTE